VGRLRGELQTSRKQTKPAVPGLGDYKTTWKKQFSDPFVTDPYHIIMTGRAGYEYDYERSEDTGKRELHKTGIKMKVEGETAYEPDMRVLMERYEEVLGKVKRVWREAKIVKDRSTILDGKTIQNPRFEDFVPSVKVMLAGAKRQSHKRKPTAPPSSKQKKKRRNGCGRGKKPLRKLKGTWYPSGRQHLPKKSR
jgi:hypothetical protein